jgi:hypothetical protein
MAVLYLTGIMVSEIIVLLGYTKKFYRIPIQDTFQCWIWIAGLIIYYCLRKKEKATHFLNNCVLLFIALAPIAVLFLLVCRYSVNCISWDQWPTVKHLVKYANGTLSFADFLVPYGDGHVEIFPRLIMFSLALCTGYNTIAEVFVNLSCLLVALGVVLLACKKQFSLPKNILYVLPVCYLVLNPGQAAQILYGSGLNWFLVNVSVLASLYLLHETMQPQHAGKLILRLVAAIAFAAIANFSLANGVLVWEAGLIQIFITRPLSSRKAWVIRSIWIVVGLCMTLFYLSHAELQNVRVGDNPSRHLNFIFSLIGLSLGGQWHAPLVWGMMLFSLLAIGMCLLYKCNQWRENAFWISVLVFALCSLLLIFIGRHTQGIPDLRYITVAILLVTPLYIILLNLFLKFRNNFVIAVAYLTITCLIIAGIPLTFTDGFSDAKSRIASFTKSASLLSTYELQSDDLLNTFAPDHALVKKYAPILKRLRYNVFRQTAAESVSADPAEGSRKDF